MSNSGSPNVALYKYVSEERFARALIERGEVFMQTLANFRGYEDNDIRQDPNDGSLRYEPAGGLPIQFAGRTERTLGWLAFRILGQGRRRLRLLPEHREIGNPG